MGTYSQMPILSDYGAYDSLKTMGWYADTLPTERLSNRLKTRIYGLSNTKRLDDCCSL